ncbi:MAG: hypothetical protein ABFS03_12000 [Chloroflexota bacterium]
MKYRILSIFVMLFLFAACGGTAPLDDVPMDTPTTEEKIESAPSPVPPTQAPKETAVEEILPEPDLMSLLSAGQVELGSLFANVDQETSGPILTMQLVNQSDGELIVEIPCGLIFVPDDDDEQPLMVVHPETITIPLGEKAEFTPYVVCADIGAGAPSIGATYTVGTFTEDTKMLQLVDCICEKGFDTSLYSEGGLEVQMAVWYTQMGGDPAGYIRDHADQMADGSLEDFDGSEESVQEMAAIFENHLGDWLESCGIEFEE